MNRTFKDFSQMDTKDIIEKIKNDHGNAFTKINTEITSNKVIGIKDIHNNLGEICSAGSKILNNYQSMYESTVTRLLKKADYSIVGSLNMDEFAMGFNNENSYFGKVENALNNEYSSGGSSGGSAYAVSRGLIPVATGTDTGGSIRQPAAFNGVYGFKPTYGLISRYGTVSFASSFDTIGLLSNSLTDNKEVLKILAQNDEYDQTNYVPDDYTLECSKDISTFKIAYIKEWQEVIAGTKVGKMITDLINDLKNQGYEVEEVSIPTVKYSFELYMILAYSEASSNLSRYDGMRFGLKATDNDFGKYRKNFGNEVKKRLVIGGYMTSSANSNKYFKQAQLIRGKISQKMQEVLGTYDIILGPITADEGIKLAEKNTSKNEKKGYLSDYFLIPANLTGIPSLSMPYLKLANNMSLSLQIISNKYSENKIYKFAEYLEQLKNQKGEHDE